MRRRVLILFALAGLAVTTGCERAPRPLAPPVVHYGQDMCAVCSMIVSEERFAGAVALRRGKRIEHFFFDDIGEMLAEYAPPEHEEIAWYVHDADTLAWLDASEAWYVRSEDLRTPMATGVAAYATRAAAETARETHGGTVLDFAALRRPDGGE